MKRQGDLLIVKVESVPDKAAKLNHRVLAEGEATGHFHELDTGELYEHEGTLFFRVPEFETATLKHPEHKHMRFEPGAYKVVRQREYAPQEIKYVSD